VCGLLVPMADSRRYARISGSKALSQSPIVGRYVNSPRSGSAFRPVRGGLCGRKSARRPTSCWSEDDSTSIRYFDQEAALNGVRQIRLQAGVDGEARLSVELRGDYVELPPLPLVESVVLQFVADDGTNPPECWQSTFGILRKNGTDKLLAKSD
jgi:hypothetical protein